VAAGTGELPLFAAGGIELEELAQHGRSRLMHTGANRHLYRF
jgi:hypothetical protein